MRFLILGVVLALTRIVVGVTVSSLLVENKDTPLGVDVVPRFSWIVSSPDRNVSQVSYQLVVSGGTLKWDSGIVKSNLPYLRPYTGPSLQSDTHYFWTVNVVTTSGSASASSSFTTGFLSQSDWNGSSWIGNGPPTSSAPQPSFGGASWIWTSDTQTNPPVAPVGTRAFRKTVLSPANKKAVSASVLLTVDDTFSLYVNGLFIGSSPAAVDTWRTAQSFPVGTLNPTSNLFAIRATNTQAGSAAGLLASIQVTFNDGTNTTISSDSSWKSNLNAASGFELVSTDDSTWSNSTIIGTYGIDPWDTGVSFSNSLTEHPAPLLRKKFNLKSKTTEALLYYASGGFASIRINGSPASNHVLSPGFTDYTLQVQYVVLNASSLLVVGDNVVAVELGRGHYGMTNPNGWNWQSAPWHAEPTLRFVLSLKFADGSSQKIVSDGTWKITDGPTRLDDLWGGENYDGTSHILWIQPYISGFLFFSKTRAPRI